jgi:hypothetical protein
MGRLLSVNVGLPRDISWRGETVHTSVWKDPIPGPSWTMRGVALGVKIVGVVFRDKERLGLTLRIRRPPLGGIRDMRGTRKQSVGAARSPPAVAPEMESRQKS